MKTCILNLLTASILLTGLRQAAAQGTAFTYQGQLSSNGAPASGSYDLTFTLYAISSGGAATAGPVTNPATGVSNGLFTATINFGAGVFTGASNWLEIAARPSGSGIFTTLAPRQQMTPVPYALYATNAGLATTAASANSVAAPNVIGTLNLNQLPSTVLVNGETSVTLSGTFSGSGGGLTGLNASALISGVVSTNVLPGFQAPYNTIGGGVGNTASGIGAFVGGGGYDGVVFLSNTASGPVSVVGGGLKNRATNTYATVGGGFGNTASGIGAFVGGGGSDGLGFQGNTASGSASVVGGGLNNRATNAYAIVGGGFGNTAGDVITTVAGGENNSSTVNGAAIGGGFGNVSSGQDSVVGGGNGNQAGPNSFATIGGGMGNIVTGYEAAVGGGGQNQAIQTVATVAGGDGNIASGVGAFIGGGGYDGNSPGPNVASGAASVIGGGENNQATNAYATVPGGAGNLAGGQYSFAAGFNAQATNNGAFVWADSQNAPFSSTASNQFLIRAQGGVGININNPGGGLLSAASLSVQGGQKGGFANPVVFFENTNTSSGNGPALRVVNGSGTNGYGALSVSVNVLPGSANGLIASFGNASAFVAWITNDGTIYSKGLALTSDRNAKENFTVLDHKTILAKVAAMPVSEWNYKNDKPEKKHIGPVAQDFEAAFGLNGADDTHISVVDEGGVALAAIQGLNEKVDDKEARIQQQAAEINDLKQQNNSLAVRLNELEATVRALAQKK